MWFPRFWLGSALSWLPACSEPALTTWRPTPLPRPLPAPVAEVGALGRASIPRFFELGTAVHAAPGLPPMDTSGWPTRLLAPLLDGASPNTRAEGTPHLLVYPEPDPRRRVSRRYGLVLPPPRSYSANDRVAAYWSAEAVPFDFGVDASHSFGGLAEHTAEGIPQLHRLKALYEPTGTNAQAFELIYAVEGSELRLLEHKGLIPGTPLAFERFTLYDPRLEESGAAPRAIAAGSSGMSLQLGLLPSRGVWARVESFEVNAWQVVFATDDRGEHYFLAAPSALEASTYFGAVASDLIIDSSVASSESAAEGQAVAALLVRNASTGTLLSGKLEGKADVASYLARGAAFLADYDTAFQALREHGAQSPVFLEHYTRQLLQTHASKRDPRAVTELAYGDHFYPVDVRTSSANIRYARDPASVLLGLVHYQHRTEQPELLDRIWGLVDSSREAQSASGAVYATRFDSMLIGAEQDTHGRADAFIDNGAVAVSFNHLRLVVESGGERSPGVTWGAFGLVLDGQPAAVDAGDYQFSIDPLSVPARFASDQESLGICRLFTRQDGRVRVRESVQLRRGVPALQVQNQVENLGDTPVLLGEVRMTVGDFFHYAAGAEEVAQSRYGMSPSVEGVPLQVGVWMEGLPAPLWGDDFAAGWVDISAQYRALKPRYLAVYAYDRAQLYYVPELAEQLLLYNARPEAGAAAPGTLEGAALAAGQDSSKDGYAGWTSLQLRYRVERSLPAGASYTGPSVYSYTLQAPLFSTHADNVPDELQRLAPLWAELLAQVRQSSSMDQLRSLLEAKPVADPARRLLDFLHLSPEPASASVVLHVAWAQAADLLAERAREQAQPTLRQELERRAVIARDSALKGAAYCLTAFTQLRNRSDLLPSYGVGKNYGFHILLFDWAYRQTRDARYLDAMRRVADRIASSEQQGGLQITDPDKPDYGAFVQNEFSRAGGANNLDDQGIKLWGLRVAYERTLDQKYRSSAQLWIEHWLKIRDSDGQLFGTGRVFDRYVKNGIDGQRGPLAQYALLVGLAAWAELSPRARELYTRGLEHVVGRHPVQAIGTTGALAGVFSDARVIDFGSDAELGGMFLLAASFEPEPRGGVR
jgi:hypothetical protein